MRSSWIIALSAAVVGAIFMSAIWWGWDWKQAPAEPPVISTPADEGTPEVRLCLGLVSMVDGASRARSAVIMKDTAALRVAVYGIESAYGDARLAAEELAGPSMDALTGAVEQLSTGADNPSVMRQPGTLTPGLNTVVTEASALAEQETCVDRLAG